MAGEESSIITTPVTRWGVFSLLSIFAGSLKADIPLAFIVVVLDRWAHHIRDGFPLCGRNYPSSLYY